MYNIFLIVTYFRLSIRRNGGFKSTIYWNNFKNVLNQDKKNLKQLKFLMDYENF